MISQKSYILFISVIVLIFSFQSWIKADDISEFEIEGISIGDSLLDHFDKNNIDKEISSEFSINYKNKFIGLGVGQTKEFPLFKKLDQFDELAITIKPNDKNYIIHGLSGEILCFNNIDKCMSSRDQIINDLKNVFDGVEIESWERKHPSDKTGKSIVYGNNLKASNLNFNISVSVYDMSNDEINDVVRVSIRNEDFDYFIKFEAYE